MDKQCSNPGCFAHEGEGCSLGTMHFQECAFWLSKIESEEKQVIEETNFGARVPWSGGHLGLIDIQRISYRKKPIIIGLIGASNAGKTTFLLACYIQLLKGQTTNFGAFSGSYTLEAWEYIANYVRFMTPDILPKFPPHTPRGTGRVPGLLHLAFKQSTGEIIDILLTDAPGEWFNTWSINENDPTAEGARWIIDNSDIFIVAADSDKLSSKEATIRGRTKTATIQLFERMNKYLKDRSLMLLWTKAEEEYQLNKSVKDQIKNSLRNIPKEMVLEAFCTIQKPEEFLNILSQLLHKINSSSPNYSSLNEPQIINYGSFESFRGTNHG